MSVGIGLVCVRRGPTVSLIAGTSIRAPTLGHAGGGWNAGYERI